MRIAVVHPWGLAKRIDPLMWDGLHAALKVISEKHTVDWYLAGDEPDDSYDWILPWGVGSLSFNNTIERYKAKKALLCAGHPQDTNNFEKFEAIFVESPAVYEEIRIKGYRTILAFGTDTDFFAPKDSKKMYEAFFPATFSPWKRQSMFSQAVGEIGLACGLMQPDGQAEYDVCIQNGTHTINGIVPTKLIADLYNLSRVVVITAWHGSERTALEAMSSNRPLIITEDNELTASLANEEVLIVKPDPKEIREALFVAMQKQVNTRDYVLEKYSHQIYADKILKVLEGNK